MLPSLAQLRLGERSKAIDAPLRLFTRPDGKYNPEKEELELAADALALPAFDNPEDVAERFDVLIDELTEPDGSALVFEWRNSLAISMLNKVKLYEALIEQLKDGVRDEVQMQNRLVKAARRAIPLPEGSSDADAAQLPEEFRKAGFDPKASLMPQGLHKESNALAQPNTEKWTLVKSDVWYTKQAQIEYYQGITNEAKRRFAELYDDEKWTKAVKRFINTLLELGEYRTQAAVLEGVEETVRAFITTSIAANAMSNYAIFGEAGTGKTRLADVLARVLGQLGLYVYTSFKELRPSDFQAGFEGQTQGKALDALNAALEHVIFIDEAHNMFRWEVDQTSGERIITGYSVESLGVIIQWTQKHVGQYALIVAGYEDRMASDFFASDPGWDRRITKRTRLGEMAPEQLFAVMVEAVARALLPKPPIDEAEKAVYNALLKRQMQNCYGWFTSGAYALLLDTIHMSRTLGTFGYVPGAPVPPPRYWQPPEPTGPPPSRAAGEAPRKAQAVPGGIMGLFSVARGGGKDDDDDEEDDEEDESEGNSGAEDEDGAKAERLWFKMHGGKQPRDSYAFPLLYELFRSGAGSAVALAGIVAAKLVSNDKYEKGQQMGGRRAAPAPAPAPEPAPEPKKNTRKNKKVKAASAAGSSSEPMDTEEAEEAKEPDKYAIGIVDMYALLMDAMRSKHAQQLVVHDNGLLRGVLRGEVGAAAGAIAGYKLCEDELQRALLSKQWLQHTAGTPPTYSLRPTPPIGARRTPSGPHSIGTFEPKILSDPARFNEEGVRKARELLVTLNSPDGLVVGDGNLDEFDYPAGADDELAGDPSLPPDHPGAPIYMQRPGQPRDIPDPRSFGEPRREPRRRPPPPLP